MFEREKKFKKVLVLYVGGTVGMKENSIGVYVPSPNQFIDKLKSSLQMHDAKAAQELLLEDNQLVLPPIKGCVIFYEIIEYDPLLDSCNMLPKDWIRIATDVKKYYESYDGIVILHGTDTLAYTASALSFMLDGLNKPIILTGSQISIFEARSDAKDNIISSLILAGCYNIPEVCIFFANKLLRGNRTAKISSGGLEAFDSPNYHVLADVGIEIRLYKHYIMEGSPSLELCNNLNENVVVFSFFPTVTTAMLSALLQPPIAGLVLQTYGSGNIPLNQTGVLRVLKEAIQRNVLIVNITQCAQGTVSASYESGKALDSVGVVSGFDMTVEAALTKLCYVLGRPNKTFQERIEMMRTDLKGELTIH